MIHELWNRIREAVTWARVAYAVGLATSGAVGHTVAIASVVPRVEVVEAQVADLQRSTQRDRRVLDRVEGMVEGVAASLGVPIPPPALDGSGAQANE